MEHGPDADTTIPTDSSSKAIFAVNNKLPRYERTEFSGARINSGAHWSILGTH